MPQSLSTGFLVASPSLTDPNFQRTVVLLIEHRPEGSLGFVINRPAKVSFKQVLKELGTDGTEDVPDVPVIAGGPVAIQAGWLIFAPGRVLDPLERESVIQVSEHLYVSTSRERLLALKSSTNVWRHLLVLGCAGWSPGQLELEIRAGAWIPVDLDDRILFATPFAERWTAALSTLGIDPAHLVAPVRTEA